MIFPDGQFFGIEGAELEVCAQCAKYGTEVQHAKKTDSRRPASAAAAVKMPVRKSRDVLDMMEGEIVDDYGERIKKARMALE